MPLVGALDATSTVRVSPLETTSMLPVSPLLTTTETTEPPLRSLDATSTLPASSPLIVTETFERVLGIVDYGEGTSDVVQPPDEVRAGEPFEVTVLTYGGGCMRAGDSVTDTAVVSVGNVATITPYDYEVAADDVPCAAYLTRYTHIATLQFVQPGEGVLRIEGLREAADTDFVGIPTTIERRIHVR